MVISIPAIGLLFLQNKQVQTTVSEYLTEQLSGELGVSITLSSVRYNFFKRLHVYDLMIEDQKGDTLIYSEVVSLQLRKFKPKNKDVQIQSLITENSYLNLYVDTSNTNNLNFLIEHLKRDLPPEEKVVLRMHTIETRNSTFRYRNENSKSSTEGIDFSDFKVSGLDARATDFLFYQDTTSMVIESASGKDKSGFRFDNVGFELGVGKQFLTFRNGKIESGNTVADVPLVDFRFRDIRNFRYVFDSVDVKLISQGSDLEFEKIRYFFPQLSKLTGAVTLDGTMTGKFGDLTGSNIRIAAGNETRLDMDMRITGLPDNESLEMIFNIRRFRTHLNDISQLTKGFEAAVLHDTLFAQKAGRIVYSGKFEGNIRNFITDGFLSSELGNLMFDLQLQPDTTGTLRYDGRLEAKDFGLGKFTGNEQVLGDVSLDVGLNGIYRDESFSARLDGNVGSLEAYGYRYSNINLNGQLSNKKYTGSLEIRDPNIDLNFDGSVDFEQELPQLNFRVQVANLRPYYLGLRDDDPEYFASFFLETDLTGIRLDEMNGEMRLVNSLFRRTGQQIQIYDMSLLVNNGSDSSFLQLRSDLMDAEIRGRYQLSQMPATLMALLNQHLSLFPSDAPRAIYDQRFDYHLRLKRTRELMAFFFPRFDIAENSEIRGSHRPADRYAIHELSMNLPQFGFNGIRGYDLLVSSVYDSSHINFRVSGDSITLSEAYALAGANIEINIADNKTRTVIDWDDSGQLRNAGYLSATGVLSDTSVNKHYLMNVNPSWLMYSGRNYRILDSQIHLYSDSLRIDSMVISGADQSLVADGIYNPRGDGELRVSLSNISLETIANVLLGEMLSMSGRITGDAVLKSEQQKPILTSKLEIDSLYINELLVGNTIANANWLETSNQLNINVRSERAGSRSLSIDGSYVPDGNLMDFDLEINDLQVEMLGRYLDQAIENMSGLANLSLTIDGSVGNPMINGTVLFDNASFTVTQTKVPYSVTNSLRIYNNDLFLEDLEIEDAYGNQAKLNGNLLHNNFKDFRLNAELRAVNMNFLHTTRTDNEQFYGTVFGDLYASVSGPLDQLHIEADAVTGRSTDLKLPLYNPDEVKQRDFITFVSHSEDENEEHSYSQPDNPRFTLAMDLEITPGAGVQLIFDPNVGDIIDARGSGNLRIELDRNQDLNILGAVTIEEGDYLFTLQNVINKRFKVNPGGSITWSGAPTDAIIDLEAIYELKAATYNLSNDPEPDESLKKRIPVYCVLSLEGDLRNPLIVPDIELPTAQPETRTLLQNSTSTDEELMKQFISLLVLNNFLSSEGIGGVVAGGLNSGMVAGVTATELLSNQLSNWLSQISNDFDIGINYRPGDEITSDEVEVALSTQLLDNRIIISGNVDVGGNQVNASESNATNIVGDFEMEFRVTDRISVKAYNRANDDFILRNAPYTQGVGVFYRNEFNSLSDLFGRSSDHKGDDNETEKEEGTAIIRKE